MKEHGLHVQEQYHKKLISKKTILNLKYSNWFAVGLCWEGAKTAERAAIAPGNSMCLCGKGKAGPLGGPWSGSKETFWKSSQMVEVKVRGHRRPGKAAVSLLSFPTNSRSPCNAGQWITETISPCPSCRGAPGKTHAQIPYCSEAQRLSNSLGRKMVLILQNCYVLPVIIHHYFL